LNLLWDALANMFEHDRSAARGLMSTQKLVLFKHESAIGNAPAHKLFDLVKIKKCNPADVPARSFADYAVSVDYSALPDKVEIIEKL